MGCNVGNGAPDLFSSLNKLFFLVYLSLWAIMSFQGNVMYFIDGKYP